jgi:purine-binding chemotaxis protein CheW
MRIESSTADNRDLSSLQTDEPLERDYQAHTPGAPGPREIFDLRAERLAQPHEPQTGSIDGGAADVMLIFPLGNERYAFAGKQVREIRPRGKLTPLPGTPPFIAGLMNVRGRIVPVIDLRAFFDLGSPPVNGDRTRDGDVPMVLIIESSHGEVGLLTTGHPEVRAIDKHPSSTSGADLRARLTARPAGLRAEYVRAVTTDLVVLLDAASLLADPRLILKMEP